MLSDTQKREIFDRYGEEGLKAGGGAGPEDFGGAAGGVPEGFSRVSTYVSFLDFGVIFYLVVFPCTARHTYLC